MRTSPVPHGRSWVICLCSWREQMRSSFFKLNKASLATGLQRPYAGEHVACSPCLWADGSKADLSSLPHPSQRTRRDGDAAGAAGRWPGHVCGRATVGRATWAGGRRLRYAGEVSLRPYRLTKTRYGSTLASAADAALSVPGEPYRH